MFIWIKLELSWWTKGTRNRIIGKGVEKYL